MRLSPDQMIFWQHGVFKLNGTIVFTWGLMLVLVVGLAVGCLNAWHWVAKEEKAMRDESEDGDE